MRRCQCACSSCCCSCMAGPARRNQPRTHLNMGGCTNEPRIDRCLLPAARCLLRVVWGSRPGVWGCGQGPRAKGLEFRGPKTLGFEALRVMAKDMARHGARGSKFSC
jgi:hypothetical protein